jgi:hypothetical protein
MPADSVLTQDDFSGSMHALKAAVDGSETQQPNLSSSMQSIESAIVLKAMQRISSLFQQEQVPKSGGVDQLIANAANNKAAVQLGWLPGSGGSSAFVPQHEEQGVPAACNTANVPAVPSRRLNQAADGAFCGDSDVVGDAQRVCLQHSSLCLAQGPHTWLDQGLALH